MIAQSEETTGTKKWSFTPWKNFWPLPFSESAVETPPMGPKRQKGTKIDWIPRKAEKLFERFHNPSFSAKNVEMGWLAAGMDAADLAGRPSEPRRAMYLQAVNTSTQDSTDYCHTCSIRLHKSTFIHTQKLKSRQNVVKASWCECIALCNVSCNVL